MHHPTDRIIHTTAFVTPVVEHWLTGKEVLFSQIKNTMTISINLKPNHQVLTFVATLYKNKLTVNWPQAGWVSLLNVISMLYLQADLVKMLMSKPFMGALRRTYHPGMWFQYRHSQHHMAVFAKIQRLQVNTGYYYFFFFKFIYFYLKK